MMLDSKRGSSCAGGLLAGLLALASMTARGQVIETVAGNGTYGFGGDGGNATAAQLASPLGIAVDAAGNLYIADFQNRRIRKVTPTGTITTVAGNGQYFPSGDGGLAVAAAIGTPTDVAVDSAGNIFIADPSNQRIRKVAVNGVISTVAGGGSNPGGDGGAATAVQLHSPWNVAVDGAGNLYIAEQSAHRIRRVSPDGVISTFAGPPATQTGGSYSFQSGFSGDSGSAVGAMLRYPAGMGFDSSGNLYFADQGNYRIRKIDTAGVITTVAGNGVSAYSGDGGPAVAASIGVVFYLAVDGGGNVFVSDQDHGVVRLILSTSGLIDTVAGNGIFSSDGDGGPATQASLNYVRGVAAGPNGSLFIAEMEGNRVRRVSPANSRPIADAGPDLAGRVGERVQISGLQSSDAETPALGLQYQWVLESAPSGSTAALENAAVAVTGFTPDIPGDYILSLVVRDEGGLASDAAYLAVTAEIDPAFVYERRASGLATYRYGNNGSESAYDYFYPYGLAGGRPYGMGYQGAYSYDRSTGSYTSQRNDRISALDAAGEDRLVERGDSMPGSSGATFEAFYLYGRSGTNFGFYGWGRNVDGEYSAGEFEVSADGTVSTAPRGPLSIAGETEPLQYIWRYWNRNDPGLVYGSKGTYVTRDRTVSYSCGTDNLETCSYSYTEYVWHQGLYVLEGSTATRVVDTSTAVPGEQTEFSGFGHAARDSTAGTVAFVGYWIDGSGRWHQGLFRSTAEGGVAKVLDDLDAPLNGGWLGRIAVDGENVYFGAEGYNYGYGQSAGGAIWWSGWNQGVYSASAGEVTTEAAGGDAWFYRYNPDFYQYSRSYSHVDTWNYAVDKGVLAFSAYTYFYTYNSTTQTYSSSYDRGTFWKENGRVRPIARSGDTLAGTQYQGVSSACCYGDWLENRTAALFAYNSTWTYDSTSGESTGTNTYDTILARFDSDRDDIGDDLDNCPLRPNPDQADSDADDIGDVCEDTDLDGWQDLADNCPVVPNNQINLDGDGPGDACDLCPFVVDDQSDQDGDGIGDACDTDADNDTVADDVDNCPNSPNTGQANLDTDPLGDACDPDIDGDGIANAVDGLWDGQLYSDRSLVASDDFADHALGGRSYGRISGRGQLIVLVEDAPGSEEGLLITAVNGSGHGMVKQCDFSGKDASLRLEQGSVVTITCGSLRVRAMARGAQIVLDDDVLIDVQQHAEARVVDLGNGEFRVENDGEVPLPLVVNLGGDVEVTIPATSVTEISEPEPGRYEVQNTAESAQPIAITVDGRTTEVEPGETGDVEQLRDATPPVISATLAGTVGGDGWYTSDVQVSWSVADPDSPVSSSTGCDMSVVSSDTDGTIVTCSATSMGGTASQSVTVKRDAAPPQIAVSAPAEGAIYALNQVQAAAYSCDDSLSGIESCSGAVPSESGVDTASVGAKTFAVTASDVAGNVASVSRNYTVRYNLIGLQQPVDNLPVVNLVTAGRAVPVKWQLTDANGLYQSSLATFRSLGSIAVSCDAGAALDEIEEVTANGGTLLRYDAITNQFVYNWVTASSWKGKCRKLVLELSDGQKKEALFRFK